MNMQAIVSKAPRNSGFSLAWSARIKAEHRLLIVCPFENMRRKNR